MWSIPVLASGLLPLIGRRSGVLRDLWVGLATGATVVLCLFLLRGVGGEVLQLGHLELFQGAGYGLILVDKVGLFLALLFSGVWVLVGLYSFGYMKGYRHLTEYYALMLLMLGATVGMGFSANLLLLYLCWELAGVCTWRLVGFYRNPFEVEVAEKTFLMTFFGSTLMLAGFGALYQERGSLNLLALKGAAVDSPAALLILAGIVAKSASIPLHTWLADAHPAAPSPMSGLLSGVIAKLGVILYIRIFVQSLSPPPFWGNFIAGLAVASGLVAGGCALLEKDYKRILAFSTVSQLAYCFIGFAFASKIGVVGGLLYLASHCLGKAGLFLGFGVVERSTNRRQITELGGLLRHLPVTGTSILLLSLSIIGIPPLLGFFSKFLVVLDAAQHSHLVAIGAVLVALFTLLYLLRVFHQVFLGEERRYPGVSEPVLLTGVVVAFALASVAAGLCFRVPFEFLTSGVVK